MQTKPFWKEAAAPTAYPTLDRDIQVDVLVVGGGITGVSTAHLLAESGLKVALVERYHLGNADTGHTTAHITYMTDTRLSEIVRTCGEENSRLAWEAGLAAMDHIRAVAAGLAMDVALVEVPGYLVAATDSDTEKERTQMIKEAQQAASWGFDVEFVESIPPTNLPGIRFARQLKFHPLLYLHAVAAQACASGALIFENTEVTEFLDDPPTAIANGHRIDFGDVVIATHMPLQGNRNVASAVLLQTKLASYSTYALAARVPSGSLEEMIWSDTAEPFNYLRVERGQEYDVIIFGGADHKTGQVDSNVERFEGLERTLREIVGDCEVTHRWSGRVVDTVDGLPYIGPVSNNNFVGTGFIGNGMTFSVVTALMARDHIMGRENPWQAALSPNRRELAALPTYVQENKGFPYHLVKDRLTMPKDDGAPLDPGEGRVVKADGKRIAMCCDSAGTHHQVSAICPHMGCIVAWNDAEQTWDCPCHGSRFAADGTVIAGPAEEGLAPVAG